MRSARGRSRTGALDPGRRSGRPGTPSARLFASPPGLRRRAPPRACSSTRALRYLDRVSAIFAATGYSAPEAMILGAELASAGPAGAHRDRAGPPRGWAGGGERRAAAAAAEATAHARPGTFATRGRAADELGSGCRHRADERPLDGARRHEEAPRPPIRPGVARPLDRGREPKGLRMRPSAAASGQR